MKKCEDYELAISAYVDGEIAQDERGPLFEHLSSCDHCDGFLQDAIRIRVEAARVNKIPAPSDVVRSFVPPESKTVFRYSPDAPAAALAPKPRGTGSYIRTLALAVLIIVIGCVMFSTTISVASRGQAMIQPPQANGIR